MPTSTKTFTKTFVAVAFLAAAGAVVASGFIFSSLSSSERGSDMKVAGYLPSGYTPGYQVKHPKVPGGYLPKTPGYTK